MLQGISLKNLMVNTWKCQLRHNALIKPGQISNFMWSDHQILITYGVVEGLDGTIGFQRSVIKDESSRLLRDIAGIKYFTKLFDSS